MKQVLGYVLGAMLLFTPLGLRVLTRSDPVSQPLDEAEVAEGKTLFTHEWTANDPLSPEGDGLGPVFNAKSCIECHTQGGLGGAGANKHNVTVFFQPATGLTKPVQGVIHSAATAPQFQETLAHAHTQMPALSRPTLEQLKEIQAQGRGFGVEVGQRNTPALFGARLIDEMPDRVILAEERSQKLRWHTAGGEHAPVGRALRLPDGRLGKFGWKAQSASLLDFVQAACANELGLGNPGAAQPVPLALATYRPKGFDLTQKQCEQMTTFIAALPRPVERAAVPADVHQGVARGRQLFSTIGCAECHTPNLGSVEGLYSDLLVHRMGMELVGGGSYNAPPPGVPDSPGSSPLPDEWRTPPLWGVADSAPYLHDGRAATLEDAINQHAGQAQDSARRFAQLPQARQMDVLSFLKSLRAPG